MGLFLLRPCGFNLGGPLVGFCSQSEQLFSKAVRESRQGSRYGQCLIATHGKVNGVVVDSIIANESAGVSQVRHFGRQFERFNFLRKVVSLSVCGIHHALNTDSQHCTCRSRGQIDDALRFFENFFCFLRHAINGGNSGTSRVGDFPRNFKNQFSAIRASPEADLFRFIKLTLVSLDAETRAEGTTIVVSIGSHFAAFEEAFQNWVLSKYRGGSAAWASHGFGFCHWRNV